MVKSSPPLHPSLRLSRPPHPPSLPPFLHAGRSLDVTLGRPSQNVSPRRDETRSRPPESRPCLAKKDRPHPLLPARARSPEASRRLDRPVPPLLGRRFRFPRTFPQPGTTARNRKG